MTDILQFVEIFKLTRRMRYLGFTESTKDNSVFWDNTPCSVITIYPRFGRTWTINISPKRGRIFLNRFNVKGKVKGKVHPTTGHKGPAAEDRCTSTLSLTSALDGDGWSTPRPGQFTPGKNPVPIVKEAGWAPGPVWTGAENLAPTGIRYPDCPARPNITMRKFYDKL